MKRFWLVLLLVMAFSTSVFAADVKFTGSFYAAGMYQDNTFTDKDVASNASTAFYYQRLRVQMDFVATPYLKLITRFDAMERVWGNTRSAPGVNPGIPYNLRYDFDSYGTRAENENIAFDWAYIWYASKIGLWSVGIQEDGAWGTVFANNARPEGKIAWMLVKMPVIAGLQIVKLAENDSNYINGYTPAEDADVDKYQGYVIYNFSKGQVGVLGVYQRWQEGSFVVPLTGAATDLLSGNLFVLMPYAKLKFGPVAIEAEVDYAWGEMEWADGIATDDIKIRNLEAYIDALADFGMFYVGGTLAFMDGDKQSTADKLEGGILSGGRDWNPCLMMFNWDRFYWANNIIGPAAVVGTTNMGAPMNNAYFAQIRAGVRPVAALDIMMSISYADAVRTPALNTRFATGNPAGVSIDNGNNEEYGWEVDVTATYKITNNLTYMLGGGYWFVGDYYKGITKLADTDDNFIVLNKLTLTF
ncbi:MAG: hypothetical protein JW925_03075 [Syntrophaceae bacterium]|nr:hypothetical protein [Syntrophaceae bacterium]